MKYQPKKKDSTLNLAPMIDIVFLLLIFFLVSSTLQGEESIYNIVIPDSSIGQSSAEEIENIFIDQNNNILTRKPKNREEFNLYLDAEEVDKLPELEKHLGFLNFIAQVSPTLGLLGTVSGMIKTFQVLGVGGSPEQMALGISEALFTTAAGLIISLPAAAFYHYFYAKIEKLHNQLNNLRLESESRLYKKEIKELKDNEVSA